MNIKTQTQALWKLCFHDSDEFIQLYFSRRYTDSINHYLLKDDKVVAALQTIPYPMTLGGDIIPTAYISGACTHPTYRKQGLMRKLLRQTHRELFQKGVILSSLIPAEEWLRGYYGESGYINSFYLTSKTIVINNSEKLVNNCDSPLIFKDITCEKQWNESLFQLFSQNMYNRNACLQHSKEDLWLVNEDFRLSDGKIYLAKSLSQAQALVWGIPDTNGFIVKEITTHGNYTPEEIIRQTGLHFHFGRLTYFTPTSTPGKHSKGMLRIIHAGKMLNLLYRIGSIQFPLLQLTGDIHIPENNGVYELQGGKYIKKSLSTFTSSMPVLSLKELADQYLNLSAPYMSLMMD